MPTRGVQGAITPYTQVRPTGGRGDGYGGALAGRFAGTAASAVTGFMTGGLAGGGASGLFGGLLGGGGGGADFAELQSLIQQQIDAQATMQTFSTRSNLAKTEHETAMTTIRNMRA